MPTLHVIVPVYNERDTLAPCLRRVVESPLPGGWTRDLYLVDDGSAPGNFAETEALARRLQADGVAVSLQRHAVNRGKGAALQTGFDAVLEADAATDDIVIVQDADLEYDPNDYDSLMQPILSGRCAIVIGTRWGDHNPLPSTSRRLHARGNAALTWMSNLMTGYRLRDMECCYKVMTVDVLRRLRPLLTEPRFGVEPQMVAALSRLGEVIEEVPVRYEPRSLSAGKKIGWTDGVRAIYVIARERLRPRPRPRKGCTTRTAGEPRS